MFAHKEFVEEFLYVEVLAKDTDVAIAQAKIRRGEKSIADGKAHQAKVDARQRKEMRSSGVIPVHPLTVHMASKAKNIRTDNAEGRRELRTALRHVNFVARTSEEEGDPMVSSSQPW